MRPSVPVGFQGAGGRNPASLLQLNVEPDPNRYRFGKPGKSEIVMAPLSARAVSGSYQPVENAEAQAVELNHSALEFMLGAQTMMFEELVFLGDEMLERGHTEMHLFNEFVAKMASARSVKELRMMGLQCGEHQLDFLRRDSERLFRHSERMIATMSKLINGRPLS